MTSKAQFEFVQEDDKSITINVYDPLVWENWDGRDIIDIMEKMDPGSPLIRLMTTMLSASSYCEEVHKIVDMRSGRVIDVSGRTWGTIGRKTDMKDSHIRSVYDNRVERGVIDPEDFPFEAFKKDFKENNP